VSLDAVVQQQEQPVVVEVAEPVPDPLDLPDQQVDRFVGPLEIRPVSK
jgi:hypothetical protein